MVDASLDASRHDGGVTLLRRWRIVEVDDGWDLELDIEEPAHLTLDSSGKGSMAFFLLGATVDARVVEDRVEFTWEGTWELDDMSGRGRAHLTPDGHLAIHLWIHWGDEMDLRAIPA